MELVLFANIRSCLSEAAQLGSAQLGSSCRHHFIGAKFQAAAAADNAWRRLRRICTWDAYLVLIATVLVQIALSLSLPKGGRKLTLPLTGRQLAHLAIRPERLIQQNAISRRASRERERERESISLLNLVAFALSLAPDWYHLIDLLAEQASGQASGRLILTLRLACDRQQRVDLTVARRFASKRKYPT